MEVGQWIWISGTRGPVEAVLNVEVLLAVEALRNFKKSRSKMGVLILESQFERLR